MSQKFIITYSNLAKIENQGLGKSQNNAMVLAVLDQAAIADLGDFISWNGIRYMKVAHEFGINLL